MSEMKTIKFPGDSEPREIVDVKARESVGEKIGYVVQELTPKQQAQARENIGVEDSVLAMLVDFGIAPVLLDSDGAMLVENDGTILINK